MTKGTWNSQLSERASKLTEKGAHYFIGWLIRAGMDNPEVMAEFLRALKKVETDPSLRDCLKEEERNAGHCARQTEA